jgi:hypothetical protein
MDSSLRIARIKHCRERGGPSTDGGPPTPCQYYLQASTGAAGSSDPIWPQCTGGKEAQPLTEEFLETGPCPKSFWQGLPEEPLPINSHHKALRPWNGQPRAVAVYLALSRISEKEGKKAFLQSLLVSSGEHVLSRRQAQHLADKLDLGPL